MTEQPHKFLLPREAVEAEIIKHFGAQIELFEEIVNYASNLVVRAYETSEKKVRDLVIVHNFVKQAACILDGINILARRGAVIDGTILLRSLIEISFYLEWLFLKNTEERALLYHVWNIRRKRDWWLRGLPETKENLAYLEAMKDGPPGSTAIPFHLDEIRSEIVKCDDLLANEKLAPLNKRFEETKSKDWYAPEVPNLREMTKEIRKESAYVAFFGPYSQLTHGLALDAHVNFSANDASVGPIRTIVGLDQLLMQSYTYAVTVFQLVLGHYRPGELEGFSKKYLREWRDRYQSIPLVEEKSGIVYITTRPAPPIGQTPTK